MTKLSDLITLQSVKLPLVDNGGYFTTDNIEAALSELAVDTNTLSNRNTGSQTLGTLSQTMNVADEAIINLSQTQSVPVIVAYKEVLGTNLISNDWSIESNDPLWDFVNTQGDVDITPAAISGAGVQFTKASGSWNAGDVGKTIINTNGTGRAIISSINAAVATCDITEAFPDTNAILSSNWVLADGHLTSDGKFQPASATKTAAITNNQGQIDTSQFTDMNSMSVTDLPNQGEIDYTFSTDGRTTWQIVGGDNIIASIYGGTGDDGFMSDTTDSSDNIICAGWTSSEGQGSYDALVMKFDSNLNILAKKIYGGIGDDRFFSVTTDSSDNIICAGLTTSEGSDSPTKYATLVVKFDNNLSILAKKVYGGSIHNYFIGITDDSFGNIICCSRTSSDGFGDDDCLVAKFPSAIPSGTFVGSVLTNLTLQDSNLTLADSNLTLATSNLTLADSALTLATSNLTLANSTLTQKSDILG